METVCDSEEVAFMKAVIDNEEILLLKAFIHSDETLFIATDQVTVTVMQASLPARISTDGVCPILMSL